MSVTVTYEKAEVYGAELTVLAAAIRWVRSDCYDYDEPALQELRAAVNRLTAAKEASR